MNYGYLDCYKLLYGTSQFPYWFIFQACYSCYVTHKSIESLRKTPNLFFRQLIIAFCMTFAPREIFAFAFKKLSPIKHNPQSIIIFLGIYGLICIKPIYKIINFFAKLIGMAQGVNVARFFTLALRNIKGIPAELILPIAIIFSVMDQLIEFIFSTIFKTKESEVSNKNYIIIAGFFNSIYWLYSHRNYFTQYIGLHSVYFPGLILALVLSASNSTFSVFVQNDSQQQRNELQQNGQSNVENDQVNQNVNLEEQNKNLTNLVLQLQKKIQDTESLKSEIDQLKKELEEERQRAKEDHDKLTAEIQRLNSVSKQ